MNVCATKLLAVVALGFVLGLAPRTARAQEAEPAQNAPSAQDAPPVRLELSDGSVLIGIVETETEDTITFRTVSGATVTVPKASVVTCRQLEGRVEDGAFVRRDPNRTRLSFGPTARPLGRGNGYVADYQVFLPFVAVGTGRALTLAGGVSLIPGAGSQLVYAAPKLTLYDRPTRSVAVGAFAGTVLGEGEFAGLLYGIGTFGRSDAALTVGSGFAFGGGEIATEAPIFLLGGEYQVSNSLKLVSENYHILADDGVTLLSGGIRFFGDQLAATLALGTSPQVIEETDGFPFFPIVSFAYNFGQ